MNVIKEPNVHYRNLVLRINRNLGIKLLEKGIVSEDQLTQAYNKLLNYQAVNAIKQSSLLKILIFDLNYIEEKDVIKLSTLPLIDLTPFDVLGYEDIELCWATWTLPFDTKNEYIFLATVNALSNLVKTHWESTLGSKIIWYTTSFHSIQSALNSFKPQDR